MNRVSLEWVRYPDRLITAIRASGLSAAQLQHYARQAGFATFQDSADEPLLFGLLYQRDELLNALESAGYEIDIEEIVMPEVDR